MIDTSVCQWSGDGRCSRVGWNMFGVGWNVFEWGECDWGLGGMWSRCGGSGLEWNVLGVFRCVHRWGWMHWGFAWNVFVVIWIGGRQEVNVCDERLFDPIWAAFLMRRVYGLLFDCCKSMVLSLTVTNQHFLVPGFQDQELNQVQYWSQLYQPVLGKWVLAFDHKELKGLCCWP